jgi:hypothetical protein
VDLVSQLASQLAPDGFDLVHPFAAQRYNTAVQGHPALVPLECFGRPATLAVVIANSRALWPRFLAALRATPALRAAEHPLDQYAESSILSVVSKLPVSSDLRFASEREPRRVSMLHAADASGFARLSSMRLAVHPSLGSWFGLRALIAFDADVSESLPQAHSPCASCAAPCAPLLELALDEYRRLGHESAKTSWRTWLAVRDACPVGRAHRYDAEQLHYHYTKDRARLLQLL